MTKCEVKMAEYWPSSLFAFLWTETIYYNYGIKNTEKMIFVLVYFQALKRKPVICKSDVLFSLFSFSLTLSVFLFSSFIPTEKSRKIFLLPRKIFCKKNFCVPTWTLAKFYCGNKMGNPEQAISAHLARLGSQSEHRNCFTLPTRGACHIISSVFG